MRGGDGGYPATWKNPVKRTAVMIGVLGLAGGLAGCGYHTAGHATAIPDNIRTIAVPAFASRTQTFKIEQILTAAFIQELVTRTHYRVVNQPSEAADATLIGTVLAA